jgi:hypothetical protein
LTEEEAQKAFTEAYREYGRNIDPKLWNVFLHGPEEKWARVHTKLMYQCHGPPNWIGHRCGLCGFGTTNFIPHLPHTGTDSSNPTAKTVESIH